MPILPFKLNQERRRHIPRQRYSVTNSLGALLRGRPAYDASLRQRGSLTIWFTDSKPDTITRPLRLRSARNRLGDFMNILGNAIEAAERALAPIPVLRRNEALIEAAAASNGRVGLLATFGPTLETMQREFPPGTLAA